MPEKTPQSKPEPRICVEILPYINDCHPSVPKGERQWIAEFIARNFDCSRIYDVLDEYIFTLCRENKIELEDADD